MEIQKYEVKFFPVGKSVKGGDAIFIRLYDEDDNVTVILIDGGYKETGESVIKYMKFLNLDTIHLMVNTHPDLDHISGLVTIMQTPEIKVEKLLYNRPWRDHNITADLFSDGRITDKSLNKRLTESFKKAYQLEQLAEDKVNISSKKCEIVHPVVGNCYFGCFHILGPTAKHYRDYLLSSDKTPTNENNKDNKPYVPKKLTWSKFLGAIIPWLDYGNTSDINETSVISFLQLPDMNFLFTGDSGEIGIKEAVDYLYGPSPIMDYKITHLQLPHHGSKKNINPTLIKRIACKNYIISCPAEGEDDGHPSARLVNKILELFPNARIHKTAGRGFVYHSNNIKVNATPVSPMQKYPEIED